MSNTAAQPKAPPVTKALKGAQLISVDLIEPNPYQPRGPISTESVADLIESVKEIGILQPLLVSRKDDRFILIAGHRRMAAAKAAGLTEVPCLTKELADNELLRYSLVENLQREDLTPLEEAASLQQLIESQKLDLRKVAELIGKSKSYVGERVDLLRLPEDVKNVVASGELSLKKAIELKKVGSEKLRAKLIERGGSGDLEEFKQLVNTVLDKSTQDRKPREIWDTLPELREFSQKAVGVRLYKDRISFKFTSHQDLRDLLSEVIELIKSDTDRKFLS